MTLRIVVRQEARTELGHAIDWYQMQRPGLGDRFLQSFLDTTKSLLDNPKRFQIIEGEVRRVRLRGFSYNILYSVEGDEVVVIACAHSHRRPGYWRDRTERR